MRVEEGREHFEGEARTHSARRRMLRASGLIDLEGRRGFPASKKEVRKLQTFSPTSRGLSERENRNEKSENLGRQKNSWAST